MFSYKIILLIIIDYYQTILYFYTINLNYDYYFIIINILYKTT